jgi:hypothetical protein
MRGHTDDAVVGRSWGAWLRNSNAVLIVTDQVLPAFDSGYTTNVGRMVFEARSDQYHVLSCSGHDDSHIVERPYSVTTIKVRDSEFQIY